MKPTGRLLFAAVLVGLAWYALVIGCLADWLPEPWSDYRPPEWLLEGDRSLAHLGLALSFAFGVLVPVWFFRRAFQSMERAETFAAAALMLPMVVLCFTAAMMTLSLFGGIEEIQEEPTLLGKLGFFVFLVVLWSVGGVAGALQAFYVFLPLSWLSILFLRFATGGGAQTTERWSLRTHGRRPLRQHEPKRVR